MLHDAWALLWVRLPLVQKATNFKFGGATKIILIMRTNVAIAKKTMMANKKSLVATKVVWTIQYYFFQKPSIFTTSFQYYYILERTSQNVV